MRHISATDAGSRVSARTLLLTSLPPAWQGFADITTATMRKYCEARGYEIFADCSETSMPLKSPWTDQPKSGYCPPRYFIKFALLEHYLDKNSCLKESDTVAWID